MPLSVGGKIGPYEIVAPLGAGGMGEVYRAHDSKLKRDVALKVLPDAFAGDPERLARFTREAQVLASLNHPGIAQIYGVEERALVMELVEGASPKGPMPFEDAWAICSQIADALEYAHDKGIVHRDLKPSNVMVTPQGVVKLLDFGLAKAFNPVAAASANEVDRSPTLTLGATHMGVILGTAAYMAPEQAKGRNVDKRADVWSFGVVLYELLTGERLFKGDDVSETLAHVLTRQPEIEKAPVEARRLLRRCLEKDPKKRLRDIAEARYFLDPVPSGNAALTVPPMQTKPRPSWVAWGIAALLAVVAGVLGSIAYRHAAEDPPRVAKLTVLPPEKGEFVTNNAQPALSPDGRHIAFIANVDGKNGLWVRDLDSSTPRLLPGTEGATFPFWSPDSRYVGFAAGGKLKKIDVAGGPALTICDVAQLRGASWNKDDVIVFAPNGSALSRVPAAGGVPAPVTELDKSRNESGHRYPWFLPDGHHFLYMGRSTDSEKTAVFVGDLQSKMRQQVVAGDTQALYAAPMDDKHGYVVFLRDRTLLAQPFDAGKLATTGDAVPIAEQVDHVANNHSMVALSQNGVLAYLSGGRGGNTQISWFDRSGKPTGTVGVAGTLEWASLSPDGATVATERFDPQTGSGDLWLHDLSRGTPSRLTFSGSSQFPIWSPDGTRVAFQGTRGGKVGVYTKSTSGTGAEEALDAALRGRPTDWSRDGRYVFTEDQRTGDVVIYPQAAGKSSEDKKPYVYLHSEFRESMAKLSPDGRWLAYYSGESKRNEIYVVSFPKPEGKWQISAGGGTIPVWSRDGRELYFVSADNKMMAVEIKTEGGKFQASVPKPLFDVRLGTANPNFDVSKDGRFLIPTAVEQAANVPMTLVLNWQAGLKK